MNYNNWSEHVGFSGWNCPIGKSQWDVDEDTIDCLSLDWEDDEEEVETP